MVQGCGAAEQPSDGVDNLGVVGERIPEAVAGEALEDADDALGLQPIVPGAGLRLDAMTSRAQSLGSVCMRFASRESLLPSADEPRGG
jgi:hypothetical protein